MAILQHRSEVALPRHVVHQLRTFALQAIQLLAGHYPHRAVRCPIRPGQTRRQAERCGCAMHAAIRLAVDQAIQGADQQPAPAVEHHPREAALQRHAGLRREIVEAAIRPQAAQAMAFEQQPHPAIGIHGHAVDQRLWPIGTARPLPPVTIGTVAHQIAACITQPQGVVVIHVQRADAVVGQAGPRAAIDDGEFQAVVADQALPGGEPQVAIGGLGDVAQRVMRQSVARTPAVDGVVAQACARARGRVCCKRAHPQQRAHAGREPALPLPPPSCRRRCAIPTIARAASAHPKLHHPHDTPFAADMVGKNARQRRCRDARAWCSGLAGAWARPAHRAMRCNCAGVWCCRYATDGRCALINSLRQCPARALRRRRTA